MKITILNYCWLIFVLGGCNLDIKTGHLEISNSIDHAKKNNVFVQSLSAQNNNIKVNDSLTLILKEAWIEYSWSYEWNKSDLVPVKDTNLQYIVLTFKNSNWRDLFISSYDIKTPFDYGGTKQNLFIHNNKLLWQNDETSLDIISMHDSSHLPLAIIKLHK